MTENGSRSGRQIGRAAWKGFLILCSILFLAAGLLYAGKRDLNNGKNKSYAAEETGYTRLTAGTPFSRGWWCPIPSTGSP